MCLLTSALRRAQQHLLILLLEFNLEETSDKPKLRELLQINSLNVEFIKVSESLRSCFTIRKLERHESSMQQVILNYILYTRAHTHEWGSSNITW